MDFDLQRIFLDKFEWALVGEVMLRTLVMFTVVLTFLRLSGKKGIRQLSVFEVAIIISLGSAAGDPMFQSDVAILPAVIVFAAILGLYRLITWLIVKSEKIETILEGNPEYIIEEGRFVMETRTQHTFAKDEFFAEMRQQSIEHLGQIRTAILETSGNVSFFFYENDQVKPGLPILPKVYQTMSKEINTPGNYACTCCGNVAKLSHSIACERCKENLWVRAINTCRVS